MGSVTMAVDGYEVLKALHLPMTTLSLMKQNDIQVHVQPKYVKLSKVTGGKAVVLSSFECEGFAAPSIINKTIPQDQFAALQEDAAAAVGIALKDGLGSSFKGTIGETLSSIEPVKGADVMWPEQEYKGSYFTIDEAVDAPSEPVDLKDARWLGQPVKGTSDGSVYHCIAVGSYFKVAARVDPTGNLSIRLTGRHQFFSEELKKMGFQMKGDYVSVHLITKGDTPRIRQCIGSMVFGLPGWWYSPWPSDVVGAL